MPAKFKQIRIVQNAKKKNEIFCQVKSSKTLFHPKWKLQTLVLKDKAYAQIQSPGATQLLSF